MKGKHSKKNIIPLAEPSLSGNELRYISSCVRSGWISSLGGYVGKFEKAFSRYCGAKYGVSVSSGTAALHLALLAMGVRSGHEVIVPSLTFVATANAALYTGAKPVFVDSERTTWNMDVGKIEEKINSKTKAIIAVHLYGHPCDMDPILKIAGKHGIAVIEDAAEAHGAEYKGRKAGSLGDIACFSFYGNKIITTGEGGMCLTNNKRLAEKIELLKDHGMSKKRRYYHPLLGYNYRITNLQSAIGLAQLERIDKMVMIKRRNAGLYNLLLNGKSGITSQREMPWSESAYWMYSILISKNCRITRDRLMKKLREKGIDTRPFFIPLHKMPYFKSGSKLPVAEDLSKRGINLPSSVTLKEREIEFIAKTIRKLC
ncbi:MAG: DegT/DnrJ/EryC1/StrS family aminotransferase [Candidatus Omnitrophota bacterium]